MILQEKRIKVQVQVQTLNWSMPRVHDGYNILYTHNTRSKPIQTMAHRSAKPKR
jgi:hypothetical protein